MIISIHILGLFTVVHKLIIAFYVYHPKVDAKKTERKLETATVEIEEEVMQLTHALNSIPILMFIVDTHTYLENG